MNLAFPFDCLSKSPLNYDKPDAIPTSLHHLLTASKKTVNDSEVLHILGQI